MRAISLAAIALGGVIAAVALLVVGRYPGSAAVFLVFTACAAAMVLAALPAPRLYGYTVLAAFLFMGWWVKAVVHTLWQLDFLEPVGAFGGSGPEWDRALLALSAAALGVLAARGAHVWYRYRRPLPPSAVPPVPSWHARRRTLVWLATLAALLVVSAANLEFAFYQIGVNPKRLLPLRLHIVAAWLINIGFALWIAALVWWDHLAGKRTLVAGFIEALLSSVSAFSRLLYLVHATPYWLALAERMRELRLGWKSTASLAVAFVALFSASLLAVFWLRASHYPDNANVRQNLKNEVPQLVMQRWTGLEGALAATTASEPKATLMLRALTESPKVGADAVYYRIASTRYREDPTGRFAFGSNAGPAGLLLISGSRVIAFVGMALLVLVLALTEEVAGRWTQNPFLLAVAGAGLANVIAQTTFFYLSAIFLVQLWSALAVIGALSRRRA